jgi:hypothetical protein
MRIVFRLESYPTLNPNGYYLVDDYCIILDPLKRAVMLYGMYSEVANLMLGQGS